MKVRGRRVGWTRLERVRAGVLVCASGLVVAGCGSSALTTQPSLNGTQQPAAPPSVSPSDTYTAAFTKLRLIAQDGCQTSPVEQVYPRCERYLAELRSAAATIQNYAPSVPGGQASARTAQALLASEQAYRQDGCAAGPYPNDQGKQRACVADLTRVRQSVTDLLRGAS